MSTGGPPNPSEERVKNKRLPATPSQVTEEARQRDPQGQRTESPQPSYETRFVPPPESSRRLPASTNTIREQTPPAKWESTSLPGTMSSQGERPEDALRREALAKTRNESTRRRREKRPEDQPRREPKEEPESSTKRARIKEKLKRIFKKDPVDESELEHIKDQNWLSESD